MIEHCSNKNYFNISLNKAVGEKQDCRYNFKPVKFFLL